MTKWTSNIWSLYSSHLDGKSQLHHELALELVESMVDIVVSSASTAHFSIVTPKRGGFAHADLFPSRALARSTRRRNCRV
jgi:hypothetical protein